MMTPNYRVLLSYDAEQKLFRARTPELTHCFGEGPTRAAAIAQIEQEIAAQIQNMQDQGKNPPRSVDEERWDGALRLQVTTQLHQGLAWQAKVEGVELSALVGEMLAAALEQRKQHARPDARPGRHAHRDGADDIGNREHRPHRRREQGYSPVLEDRAAFIQYVRDGQQPRGHGHGGQEGGHRFGNKGRRRPGGGGNRPHGRGRGPQDRPSQPGNNRPEHSPRPDSVET